MRREGHPPPAMAVGVILVAERDLTRLQGLDPFIADRHAVRVPSQVFQRLVDSAEGRFRMHGPLLLIQGREESRELRRVRQGGQTPRPLQLSPLVHLSPERPPPATKQPAEAPDWPKEAGLAGGPAEAGGGQ